MELKTLQKALEKEAAQNRASAATGPLLSTIQRAMEAQRNALAPLMAQTAQSLTRQFTEPILGNAVAEMIRRSTIEHHGVFTRLHSAASEEMARLAERVTTSSATIEAIHRLATEPCFSHASRLAEISEGLTKKHEGYMSSVEKMIANFTAQASSWSAVGSILAEQQFKARERLDSIQSSSRSHFAETEDFVRHIPSQLQTSVPPNGGATELMQRIDQHFHDAATEAEETGGWVLMKCSLPSGEVFSVSHLSLEDDYFISISGIDERGRQRTLKAHFKAVLITIEVVHPDQIEEDDDMPIN